MVFVRLCGDHRVQSPVEVRHPGVRCVAAGVGRPGYKRGDGVIEQDQRRYKHLITGLTNGAEYTVRVLAYNTNGDVTASAEAMATARGTTALPNMWLSPTASDPVAAVRSEATYSVTFQGAWTTTVTSGGVPSGAHFTTLIGGVHNAGVTFLREGGMASARGGRVHGGTRWNVHIGGRSPSSRAECPQRSSGQRRQYRPDRLFYNQSGHAHHRPSPGHPALDGGAEPGLVRGRLRTAPARCAGRLAVVARVEPVSLGHRDRGGNRILALEPCHLAPGSHHRPAGAGQVLERTHRDPDLHSPVGQYRAVVHQRYELRGGREPDDGGHGRRRGPGQRRRGQLCDHRGRRRLQVRYR